MNYAVSAVIAPGGDSSAVMSVATLIDRMADEPSDAIRRALVVEGVADDARVTKYEYFDERDVEVWFTTNGRLGHMSLRRRLPCLDMYTQP